MLTKILKSLCLLSITIGICTSLPTPTRGDVSSAPLWQKAVTIIAQNETWVPGLVTSRSEELGKKNVVKHVEETQVKLSLGPDQKIAEEVIAYSKAGNVDRRRWRHTDDQTAFSRHNDDERLLAGPAGGHHSAEATIVR